MGRLEEGFNSVVCVLALSKVNKELLFNKLDISNAERKVFTLLGTLFVVLIKTIIPIEKKGDERKTQIY